MDALTLYFTYSTQATLSTHYSFYTHVIHSAQSLHLDLFTQFNFKFLQKNSLFSPVFTKIDIPQVQCTKELRYLIYQPLSVHKRYKSAHRKQLIHINYCLNGSITAPALDAETIDSGASSFVGKSAWCPTEFIEGERLLNESLFREQLRF